MTEKYGLLGHPLGHSFSMKFHNQRFQELGIDAQYENFDIDNIDKIVDVLNNVQNLKGFNVTIPYKQQVMKYLDELDPLAEKIGAVNVIRIEHSTADGKVKGFKLKGFNSDIIGFTNSIKPMLKPSDKKALILGTGGASKAIFVALQNLGIESVYVSRTKAPGRLTYEELNEEIMKDHTVIVNCSPVGMFPNVDACPAIPYELMNSSHVCFDCVYNPEETLFMKKAKEHGAAAKCGLEMLIGQAIASYEMWTKK